MDLVILTAVFKTIIVDLLSACNAYPMYAEGLCISAPVIPAVPPLHPMQLIPMP
jgi:hypothetical protein